MARIKTTQDLSRKEVITEAAATLFKEKGYKAASMRDLAEQVGVEAASLYNHIRSKSELLHNICVEVANDFWEHIHEVENKKCTGVEKVEAILRYHIREMIANYEKVYVSDREWKHLTEPYLSNFHTQRREYRKKVASIIEQGIHKGEIKSIDAPTAVLIILHAVSGIDSWHRSKQKISAAELEANMVTILIDGLRK